MLFCAGMFSPAVAAEGNYDAGDVLSFPEELMNSILLLLQSFPGTCSRAGSSMLCKGFASW